MIASIVLHFSNNAAAVCRTFGLVRDGSKENNSVNWGVLELPIVIGFSLFVIQAKLEAAFV